LFRGFFFVFSTFFHAIREIPPVIFSRFYHEKRNRLELPRYLMRYSFLYVRFVIATRWHIFFNARWLKTLIGRLFTASRLKYTSLVRDCCAVRKYRYIAVIIRRERKKQSLCIIQSLYSVSVQRASLRKLLVDCLSICLNLLTHGILGTVENYHFVQISAPLQKLIRICVHGRVYLSNKTDIFRWRLTYRHLLFLIIFIALYKHRGNVI